MPVIKSVPQHSLKRPLTVVAQDPSVHGRSGRILTTQVEVPAEALTKGPWGYRIQVIDYDASTGKFYTPWDFEEKGRYVDPYAGKDNAARLLRDPMFHAQNVYAIAMRILSRFEFALGRRVGWQFESHQLKIAPHAFQDANAYYDRRSESLQFGYFGNRSGDGHVFTCLSHDIIAHETTHAILDGLQGSYFYPSSPDQAAFHEAFSDIVALLSVFALRDVVASLIERHKKADEISDSSVFNKQQVSIKAMRKSLLLGLAEQFGNEIKIVRGQPLRQSLLIRPSNEHLRAVEFQEPHRRGEILVAAVLNAFLNVFDQRVRALDASGAGVFNRNRVVEEAAKTADHLMTLVIRALDYCVPVHLTFGNFLSALLTSDAELIGDDTYGYRRHLLDSFADYGVQPQAEGSQNEMGTWPSLLGSQNLNYSRTHFQSFQTDYQEVYRFLWENRRALEISEEVYTRVLDVRPCLRISPEGFPLRETVVQYVQIAEIQAKELSRFKLKRPQVDGVKMMPSAPVQLYGGGTLVFDQYGRLKFSITNPIDGPEQQGRLEYLWQRGWFREDEYPAATSDLRQVHRLRSLRLDWADGTSEEAWI